MADRDAPIKRGIRLADAMPFRLGDLDVVPATRQLRRGDASEILEPRVMQVLVALATADGAVISRDELIERCWNGVVVGENAIHRAISRIRRVAETIGNGSFELETITKVGYRITAPAGAADPAPSRELPLEAPAAPNRRLFVLGSAATTAIAAAGFYLRLPAALKGTTANSANSANSANHSSAVTLYEKGIAMREGGTPMQTEQALAYFREATRLAPDMARAWGGLAYTYADAAAWSEPRAWPAIASRGRSAAQRALTLDPHDADARAALVYLGPLYRNWLKAEPVLRAVLREYPDHRRAHGLLAQLLGEVGRWREAIPHFQEITGPNDFIALARFGLVHALWNAGRIEDAQIALDAAAARWPTHPAIWDLRVKFLAFTGRPDAALALIADKSSRPLEYAPWFEGLEASVRALRDQRPGQPQKMTQLWLNRVRQQPDDARFAMEYLAAIGAIDEAFALANGFYLGRGPWARTVVAQNRFEAWVTSVLFGTLTAPMRSDSRFGPLLRQIGLEAYWRQSRTQPDYRQFR